MLLFMPGGWLRRTEERFADLNDSGQFPSVFNPLYQPHAFVEGVFRKYSAGTTQLVSAENTRLTSRSVSRTKLTPYTPILDTSFETRFNEDQTFN
jgi:enoyl reductase-like protein